MANCLVTGGAGFIGSHLVDALLYNGDTVRILDNFIRPAVEADHWGRRPSKIDLVVGSILDEETVKMAMLDIDYVFHQAALPSVPFSFKEPVLCNQVNVEGTLNVLIAARDANVKRVVFASSSSVYGDDGTAYPRVENATPRPLSPYAFSKYTGEWYCRMFTERYNLETIALRYFNVFGARQNPNSEYAAVVPKFIMSLLKKEPLPVYGNGSQVRDFTCVENVVRANILATKIYSYGGVMNVSNGESMSLLDLIQILCDLTNHAADVQFLPERTGDVLFSEANLDSAKQFLKYEPITSVREGLTATIEHFRKEI